MRLEQLNVVVVAQRLDRQLRHSGDVANRQCSGHPISVKSPLAGGSRPAIRLYSPDARAPTIMARLLNNIARRRPALHRRCQRLRYRRSDGHPSPRVSLRVHNTGALTHEVMVLPLNTNQYPGQRAIGTNNQVDETGSLAEASRSCGADAGDGVLAGATAWTTVNLPPGRYELLCNIAGHYGAGMYAELDAIGMPTRHWGCRIAPDDEPWCYARAPAQQPFRYVSAMSAPIDALTPEQTERLTRRGYASRSSPSPRRAVCATAAPSGPRRRSLQRPGGRRCDRRGFAGLAGASRHCEKALRRLF